MIPLLATASPDVEIGTALVFSNAMYEICRKINNVLTVAVMDKYGIINIIFYACVMAVVFNYLWEMSIYFRNGLQQEGSRGDVTGGIVGVLLDGTAFRKTMRFLIFFTLALGTFNAIRVVPDGADYPVQWGQLNSASAAYEPIIDNISGGIYTNADAGVPAGGAMANLYQMKQTIGAVSKNLGAWHMARTIQTEIAKAGAREAGLRLLQARGMSEDTESITDSVLPAGSDKAESPGYAEKLLDPVKSMLVTMGNAVMAFGTAAMLLVANFGLDLLIVRTLWFNALYLLLAYKAVVIFLPVVVLLAYFQSMTSLLSSAVKQLAVCIITLNILAGATSNILTEDRVKSWAQSAAEIKAGDMAQSMDTYAQKIFAEMLQQNPSGFSAKNYLSNLDNQLGNPSNGYFINMESSFYGPLRVFMILAIVITLLGKMTVIVSDAISGTMSYHRG